MNLRYLVKNFCIGGAGSMLLAQNARAECVRKIVRQFSNYSIACGYADFIEHYARWRLRWFEHFGAGQ